MQGRRVFPRRVFLGGAFSGAALAALTACASESGASSSAVSSEPSYASGWSDPAEPTRAPLTGLVSDSATIAGPALAVKIPNDTYGARPQVNLNSADHVYEELVEGGITRYVGVFHSNIPDVLGPIRSFRPMDPAIMHPYNPIVVYSGGQAAFISMLQQTGLTSFDESSGAEYMWRLTSSAAPEKISPDNLMVNAQDLWKANSSAAAPTAFLAFSQGVEDCTAVTQGSSAALLSIAMSPSASCSWVWDASAAQWLRSQDGSEDVTYDSSYATSRVTTENVVVIRVDVDRSTYASLHGSPPYTKFFGSGEAFVASGGSLVKAQWSKSETTSEPVKLVTTSGIPVRLNPGRTWFQLVPTDSGSFSFS